MPLLNASAAPCAPHLAAQAMAAEPCSQPYAPDTGRLPASAQLSQSTALQEWCRASGAECLAVQTPGRNMRRGEAFLRSAQEVAQALLPVVASSIADVPYIVRPLSPGNAGVRWVHARSCGPQQLCSSPAHLSQLLLSRWHAEAASLRSHLAPTAVLAGVGSCGDWRLCCR